MFANARSSDSKESWAATNSEGGPVRPSRKLVGGRTAGGQRDTQLEMAPLIQPEILHPELAVSKASGLHLTH